MEEIVENEMEDIEEEEQEQEEEQDQEDQDQSFGWSGVDFKDLTFSQTLETNPAQDLIEKTIINSSLQTPELHVSPLSIPSSMPLFDSQTTDLAHVASCSLSQLSHFSCFVCNRFVSPNHQCLTSQEMISTPVLSIPSQAFPHQFHSVQAVEKYLKDDE